MFVAGTLPTSILVNDSIGLSLILDSQGARGAFLRAVAGSLRSSWSSWSSVTLSDTVLCLLLSVAQAHGWSGVEWNGSISLVLTPILGNFFPSRILLSRLLRSRSVLLHMWGLISIRLWGGVQADNSQAKQAKQATTTTNPGEQTMTSKVVPRKPGPGDGGRGEYSVFAYDPDDPGRVAIVDAYRGLEPRVSCPPSRCDGFFSRGRGTRGPDLASHLFPSCFL